MSDLKQTIKKTLIYTLSVFVAFFVWELINDKDLCAAAKEAFEVFIIASFCLAITEAAHFYQTKRFI